MTSRMTRAGLALALGLGLALLASSQTPIRVATPSRAAAPAASWTPIISNSVLTPGTSGAVTSTTPGYGSNLYSIPETTPKGMPAYQMTPTAGSLGSTGPMITATARRPLAAADCAQNGWQAYTGLGFTSQKGCEDWVKRHPAASSRPAKKGAAMTTTPRATAPPAAVTPRS